MALPVILWRNLFRATGAVVTSSGADSGYSAADVGDHKSYIGWQSSVTTSPVWVQVDVGGAGLNADSLVIVNGNLSIPNGATIKIYADTVDPPTTVVQSSYGPLRDAVDYKAFTAPGAKRYWRVEFTDPSPPFAAKPFVGELLLGMKMSMPVYVAPDTDPKPYEVPALSTRSKGGHALGTTLQGIARRGTLSFGGSGGVDRSFFTSDLREFVEKHYKLLKPWAFVLDSDDSELSRPWWVVKPTDVDAPHLPVGSTYGAFSFDLPFEEAMMEVPGT